MRLGVEAALVSERLVPGDVEIADGRVAAVGLSSSNGRGIAVPGFVDVQVNGFGGVDFLETDGDGYRQAGEALLETGVTSFLPTLITAPETDLLAALAEVPRTPVGPRILGVHLEGPFLAARRLGTHRSDGRRDPDRALLERLLAAGPVRMMTLAPELAGALELIDDLVARGVTVSCGHSDATAEQTTAAFDRGARMVTHLFNAMRPFNHREPGIVGAALVRDDVFVEIILDGVHLAPATGAVRAPEGMLAGSLLSMIDAVRNLHDLGVSLEDALGAASTVPARALGLSDVGRLDVGLPADVVVLDDALEIESVFVGGEARVVA